MPKFRGNSDDWLDDESPRSRKRGAQGNSPNTPLSPVSNAVVVEVFPKLCRVRIDSSTESDPIRERLCSYKRAEIFQNRTPGIKDRAPVAVGDRVWVRETSPQDGIVEGICARENLLSRPAPGREREATSAIRLRHVIAANVTGLVIVASAKDPDFSIGIVDRYLLAAQAARISSTLCVTKTDLLAPADHRPWDTYRELGVLVQEVSARQGAGVDTLRDHLKQGSHVFCGHSGVGKTSLLRALLNEPVGRVAEVNHSTGKGRHTTTSAVMFFGPGASRWIDTPGVREFGLDGILPEQLVHFYPEFRELQCALPHCHHVGEAGCCAESLPRHASYRRIYESLLNGEN